MAGLLPFGSPPTPDATLTTKGKVKFFTQGANGITSIRFQSSGSVLYDLTVDDTGHMVTTLVSAGGTTGMSMGLLLSLTYPT